jgi:hypothetical protein
MVISTDSGVAGQCHVVLKPSTTTDADIGANDTVVPDAYLFVQLCAWINDGGMSDDGGHG